MVQNDVPSLTLEAVLTFICSRGESHLKSEERTRSYKHGFVNLLLIVKCDVETLTHVQCFRVIFFVSEGFSLSVAKKGNNGTLTLR